jgi:hypothetical protein
MSNTKAILKCLTNQFRSGALNSTSHKFQNCDIMYNLCNYITEPCDVIIVIAPHWS